MTIRELLNLVAEGNAPEVVFFEGVRFELCRDGEYYSRSRGINLMNSAMIECLDESKAMHNLIDRDLFKTGHLTSEEKRYLRAVLSPFKNRPVRIKKSMCSDDLERIRINFYNYENPERNFVMFFPGFEGGEMYRGLAGGIEYSPEDLHLWEDDQ